MADKPKGNPFAKGKMQDQGKGRMDRGKPAPEKGKMPFPPGKK